MRHSGHALDQWDMAAYILKIHGCHPIDPDYGCGLRWLESAVTSAIRLIHMQAQPIPAIKTKKLNPLEGKLNLANMRPAEVYSLLTPGQPVQ